MYLEEPMQVKGDKTCTRVPKGRELQESVRMSPWSPQDVWEMNGSVSRKYAEAEAVADSSSPFRGNPDTTTFLSLILCIRLQLLPYRRYLFLKGPCQRRTQWTEKRKIWNRCIPSSWHILSYFNRLGPWACTVLFQRVAQNINSYCVKTPGLFLCCPWPSTPQWWRQSVRAESVPVSSDLLGTRQVWIVLVSHQPSIPGRGGRSSGAPGNGIFGFLCLLNGRLRFICPLQRMVPLKELKQILYANEFQHYIPHFDVAKGSFLLTLQPSEGPAVLYQFVKRLKYLIGFLKKGINNCKPWCQELEID